MVKTPTKRTAVASPDGASRPSKRLATSSPEEGEVDDASPPRDAGRSQSPSPVKPLEKYESKKVPFPFKKKSTDDRGAPGLSKLPEKPVVYERSVEDEERYRGLDHSRQKRPPYDGKMGRPPVDRWEPSYSSRDRDVFDRNRSRGPPRPQDPQYSRADNDDRYYRPGGDRPHYSSYRDDHDRRHDSYADDRRGRGDDDRNARRGVNSYRPISPLPPRPRSPPRSPSDDRYYRPSEERSYYSHRDDHDRRHDSYVEDWRGRGDGDRSTRRGLDSYRPTSPGSPGLPPRPRSPLRSPPSGLRSPSTAPPPLPPPDSKDGTLPREHAAVSISISPKKPAAPLNIHSPKSIPLPTPNVTGGRDNGKEDGEESREEGQRVRETIIVQRRKREPVQRSRKEEQEAYGRVFDGCGRQSDYEVTTKLGEGTFGEVHKAIHTSTGRAVALKRILMHNEKEGMPVTALREIKILKALKHSCIVDILDMFVVRSKGKDSPLSVYMVFPYMDHDLAGLLENERVKLQPSHIKLYMKQLLEGTEYMHRNHILHRDMKAANLLISNTGSLRIADFGLARSFDPNIVHNPNDFRGKERKYTNCVVTRWYRPPELLLGARQYGGEIDIWGIGCVLGEMFSRKPILPGTSDPDQLDKIWQLCGSPNQHSWPNFDALPGCEGVKRFTPHSRRLKQVYETVGAETCDLLDKLLTCNPRDRITASQALDHDYFWTDPLPADPKTLPSYEASHEFDKRGRRNVMPPGPPPQMDGQFRQPPMAQPPLHFGRGPPPREAFRTGPPPPPGYPPHFPNGRPPYPPGQGPYPPRGLPGRPNPRSDRPPHLPPRPPGPSHVGRGGSYRDQRGPPRGDSPPSGELNYG